MKKYFYPFMLIGLFLWLANGCKKEDDSNLLVEDIDGNMYHSVQIGSQVWMVENLQTTKYRNGESIPNISDSIEWSNLSTGAQCMYYNKQKYGSIYGKLYNWHAVNDPRNIAPEGWHIPTDAEWIRLENYVFEHMGTSGSVAKALAASTNWTKFVGDDVVGNNLSKNNSLGFTALPGGNRYANGRHDDVSEIGCWWSSTEAGESSAWSRGIYCYYATMSRNYDNKKCGLSVRCIKD